jgi:serine/threonine-protein kinase
MPSSSETDSIRTVEVGQVIGGKYRIEHALGEGGMGSVVCALDRDSQSKVALKVMREDATALANARGRFLREIRTVRALTSRHVAKVLDAGALEDGRPYVVMEYLQGKDLQALSKTRGKLPFDEVAEYVIQACDAIGEAHAAGIIHRDLKPANLFLVDGPEDKPLLKVLDFGVSKIENVDDGEAGSDSVITNVTDMLGSPGYMAPEQLLSAKDADARSDVYSLGVIMYKLITGQPPVVAKSFHEHVDKIVKGEIEKPSSIVASIPPGLEEVIMRCLEKKPQNRFQSVADLTRALAPFSLQVEPTSLERIALIKRATPDHDSPPSGGSAGGSAGGSSRRMKTSARGQKSASRTSGSGMTAESAGPKSSWMKVVLFVLVACAAGFGIYFARTHH